MSKFLIFGMVILLSCTKEPAMNLLSEPSVTLPFTAKYQGYNVLSDPNKGSCITGLDHTVEIANGNGTYVGYSTFHSDYCSNIGTINPGLSFIKTQNGDTLYLTFFGNTCVGLGEKNFETNDHSNETCCWKIPFTILGGTGAFQDAMGNGITDDYLSATGNTYYHSWKGTITIRREHLNELQ